MSDAEEIVLAKQISFRPMTTRVLYPGVQKAEVVINGQVFADVEFGLVLERRRQ